MLPFFGTTAIVIATLAAPAAPAPSASPDAVRAAPAAAVRITAAAPSRPRGGPQHAISIERPRPPTDEEAIRTQMELRVLMPPLSGDGGG
jgi:hypothetical protein